MSEDTTRDLDEKYSTKPTLETVLERLAEFRSEVTTRLDNFETRFGKFETVVDIRFDRLEAEVSKSRYELVSLRADFNEFRSQFKEPAS
jgi:predicted nuclease with TOPRIM domain